jgi:hypothetical protein
VTWQVHQAPEKLSHIPMPTCIAYPHTPSKYIYMYTESTTISTTKYVHLRIMYTVHIVWYHMQYTQYYSESVPTKWLLRSSWRASKTACRANVKETATLFY